MAEEKTKESSGADSSSVDKSQDVRQSHSQGMMMSLDKRVLSQMQDAVNEPLPDIAKSSQASAIQYALKDEPNPLDDDLDVALGSKAQAANISAPKSEQKTEKVTEGDGQESLEERKLRLKARSDALKKKKREEEEAKNKPSAEEQKRDSGDIFRNT